MTWWSAGARLAAGLSAFCAVTHGALAWSGLRAGNLGLVGVALGMAVLCLPCAVRLWREPSPATWRMTASMTAVMLALHPSLMTLSGHHHAASWTAMNAASGTLLLLSGAAALLHRSAPAGGARHLSRTRGSNPGSSPRSSESRRDKTRLTTDVPGPADS